MRIFIGLLIVLIGFLMVWKTQWFFAFFGRIGWAERLFGIWGGTRLVIKLIAVVAIFIAFLIMTNQEAGLLKWLLGPVVNLQ
jgi:hypothetical protein